VLTAEQPRRLLSPVHGSQRVAGGQRCPCREVQQLGEFRVTRQHRGQAAGGIVCLGPGVGRQPGCQQHGAAVDGEVRHGRPQLVVAPASLGKVLQCLRHAIRGGRDEPPVVPRGRVLVLLTGQRVLALGSTELGVRPPRLAHRQQGQAAPGARPGLPEGVTMPPQDRHRPVQVAERLGVPAEQGQHHRSAHQDPACQHSPRRGGRDAEVRHPPGGMPGHGHRRAETGPDVGRTLSLAAGPGGS
jgi:hypothetical protein